MFFQSIRFIQRFLPHAVFDAFMQPGPDSMDLNAQIGCIDADATRECLADIDLGLVLLVIKQNELAVF